MSTNNIVSVVDLKKTYGEGISVTKALRGMSFDIKKGEFVAIVGTSGSGKSTLLHMLGGIDRPSAGKVFINNVDIELLDEDNLVKFRRERIGYVFQDFNLIPILTVKENIYLPAGFAEKKINQKYFIEIMEALDLVGKEHSFPNELSGGQQQRVAIARALINEPDVILADEPTGNLDKENSNRVISLLKKINRDYSQTIVMITHDEKIANVADRIFCIEDGRLINDSKAD